MDRRIAATEWDFKFRKSPPRSPDHQLWASKMLLGFVNSWLSAYSLFPLLILQIHATARQGFSTRSSGTPGARKLADVITRRHHHRGEAEERPIEQGAMTFRIWAPKMLEKGHFGWK